MEKEKMIEEMLIDSQCHEKNTLSLRCRGKDCDTCRLEKLIDAGYRKIPEGSVVLTREELAKERERAVEHGKALTGEVATKDAFMGEIVKRYEDMIKKGELQRIYDGDVVIKKQEIQKRADFKELAEMILEFSDVVFIPMKICGKEQQEQYAGDYCKRLGQAIVKCLATLVYTEKELEKVVSQQEEFTDTIISAGQLAVEQVRKETAKEILQNFMNHVVLYGCVARSDLLETAEKYGVEVE